ncbi:hypothetical protein BDN72DRAFT_906570 [Pluteus cervinus]|uniref:Uncharacterized protein n=1 Tax=Pluteus cervinus TaxID=181527 RepID=A0ACD2ZYV6_9AGAR|nr:hypothetical protein BDN72DRAFT_906570 [Pluteus cervinus]
MDTRYNIAEARVSLEHYEKSEKVPVNTYLVDVPKDTSLWLDDFNVVEIPEPHCWRLIRILDNGESEEAVFSLHGIVIGKDLPPVTELQKMAPRSHPFLQQAITLSGLDSAKFETAIDRTHDIYNKYRRFFPDNQLLPWNDLHCTITPGRTLTFSNRYFTRRKEAPTMRAIPFAVEVDPKGLLSQLITGHLFHSIDNQVSYYTRYKDDENKLVHDFVGPQTIRVGDIVDVQFSIVVYRMRTGQHVMKAMLFSIALVDGKYSDEYSQRKQIPVPPATLSVKRKTGYEVPPRPAKQTRLNHMDIDASQGVPTEAMHGLGLGT